jgi:hypothetical protein
MTNALGSIKIPIDIPESTLEELIGRPIDSDASFRLACELAENMVLEDVPAAIDTFSTGEPDVAVES